MFYLEEGPDPSRLTAKTWQKMKDRYGGVLLFGSDVLRGQPCDHVLHLNEILPHTAQLDGSRAILDARWHPTVHGDCLMPTVGCLTSSNFCA
ncbi:MAG: hypothetical protein MUO26_09915 [Methanotrichaceae archaeon]|nr:hypothetical protein [Methanotrichaceae archaeon]